ncbi:MAG: hypothetical protein AB1807_11815 [Pseudomonadota bacterium]
MTTLTNDQITAGADVLDDSGKRIGRNAAIMVYHAMQGAQPDDEEAKKRAIIEHLGPAALAGGAMSLYDAFGLAFDAGAKHARAVAPSPQIAEKVELPPLPEMLGAADMGAVLDTPEDWDADYRATWRNLQIAECNKRQWRAYALQLRDAIAASRRVAEHTVNDVCEHIWPEADGQTDIDGFCSKCSLSFQRYIHGDSMNRLVDVAPASAGQAGQVAKPEPTTIVQDVAALFRACGFDVREEPSALDPKGEFAIAGSLDAGGLLVESVIEHCENLRLAGAARQGGDTKLERCACQACNPEMIGRMMFICPACGDKRCPHAANHALNCKGRAPSPNNSPVGGKGEQ